MRPAGAGCSTRPTWVESTKLPFGCRRNAVPKRCSDEPWPESGAVSNSVMPAWAAASPAVTLHFLWDEQTGAPQSTFARLLYDDRALYVAKDSGRNAGVAITGGAAPDDPGVVQKIIDSPGRVFREGAISIQSNRDVESLSLDGESRPGATATRKPASRSA